MFVITNRKVKEGQRDLSAFDSKPNPEGPNELRVAEAEVVNGHWRITVIPDRVDAATAERERLTSRGQDENGKPIYVASQLVAKVLVKRLMTDETHLVLFVHGFNNDMEAVLNRAQGFERSFGVEVLAFSWPANGGGLVTGTASYLSDKRDALASVGALSRTLAKCADYLDEFNAARVEAVEAKATELHPDDDERWNRYYAKAMEAQCPVRISLVLHSMGNYLYKHVLQSAAFRVDRLMFENVVLVAADANNEGHAEWVDQIQCRNRIYVTINEADKALMASRMKAGEEQKARLGHFPYNLGAQRACYVDFTGASSVGDSHAYFEDKPLRNNRVKAFFRKAFNGLRAEDSLEYDVARNLYSI